MKDPNLTGTVIDSGDGVTHVIPVADGFVLGSCIKEVPLAGRHVTEFISDMLRDRQEPVPAEQRLEAARQIKEQDAYLCKDVVEEYSKFDTGGRKFKQHTGRRPKTGEAWTIDVGSSAFSRQRFFFT